MCRVQTHRGPDDQGVAPLDRVCLGSRRLSILDVSPAGHMPMSDPTGRWWITYNGEIYNYREIRDELAASGHVFHSGTDTEVLLHAFIAWRRAAFQRLDGMFAAAFYDRESGTLSLVRDRFGIKPLYYTRSEGHLLFSSELKALREWKRPLTVDRQKVTEWLLYRNVDALSPGTLIEGVRSLLPGQVVTVRRGSIRSGFFYRTVAHVDRRIFTAFRDTKPGEIVDAIDATLREAVRCRLVSDVPVGVLCSGGLDSSLVTAIAGQHTTDITAFNVSVENAPDLDEKRFAASLARNLGIPLVSHTMTGRSFRDALPRAVYHSDFPLSHPNSVGYLQISDVARAHGVVVLLSGEGADELFGGYSWRYRRLRYLDRLSSLLSLLPDTLVERGTLMAYAMAGLPATAHRFREALPMTVGAIDRFARMEWIRECERAYDFVQKPLDRAVLGTMLGDLHDFLPPLLRRLDRMTMAASVEGRVPFLDHRVVQQAINLPLRYRVGRQADKWILKKLAVRYLPPRNVWRKKMGFPIPLAAYLAPLADIKYFQRGFCERGLGLRRTGLTEIIGQADRRPFAFFGLLTLEMWGRMWVFGEAPAAVADYFGLGVGEPIAGT